MPVYTLSFLQNLPSDLCDVGTPESAHYGDGRVAVGFRATTALVHVASDRFTQSTSSLYGRAGYEGGRIGNGDSYDFGAWPSIAVGRTTWW